MKVLLDDNYRKVLEPYLNTVIFLNAKIEKFGKDEFGDKTYLLTDIKHNNFELNHCWVNSGVQIKKINIKEGDFISFKSKVILYLKNGYGKNQRADYCLSTPKEINILNK